MPHNYLVIKLNIEKRFRSILNIKLDVKYPKVPAYLLNKR